MVATTYYGLIASDVYISESRFVVRSPQRQPQIGVVGALLQGSGFTRSLDDTYPIVDYIQSRDALAALNKNNFILEAFGKEKGDAFNRFPFVGTDTSFEELLRYYQKHVIEIDFDSTSSIATLKVHAFSAIDAERLNEQLLALSEQLVNRMNARAASDTVDFAQRQVDLAEEKAKDAASALATYRNTNTVFDPERQSALQLQQVATLQAQLFAAQNQLTQLQTAAPQNPQISSLKTEIATLQRQIETTGVTVAGSAGSLSNKAATYTRLQLDSQYADKQLASAMAALDAARADAQRKQLYLERIVQPNTPDKAMEPHRIRGILATLVLGMITWGVLSLFMAGVKEHKD